MEVQRLEEICLGSLVGQGARMGRAMASVEQNITALLERKLQLQVSRSAPAPYVCHA